ncbi:LacI family transcriptional regulator [Kineosphaera limosa]|uniref:Putative LacI family transcriptional regulator n=1 Tax=Kineosphaera limosa NBRC 100340 TaxID=1184609 RepID=K6WYR5_9MICO|nr:LacI family DNA-binding transcriptional regulator [Kineosphaera limosa]NYE01088.1 LacI family transcriptional regulator [Kineosphaera limosa]GAB97237.1 putative LacI family transcriptional regulator [Kineosphaera limosa NBRC 100340]
MPPGPRPGSAPTMRDIAAEAGVSKALVSIVFRGAPGASEATRRKVFEAADRLGYRANRSASLLARTRTNQLGVVLDLHNGFHAEIVEAALTQAEAAGYHLVLGPRAAGRDERSAIEGLLEFRCEAMLLLGPTLDADELAHLAADTPVVCIGRQARGGDLDVIRSADDVGMELVVDHLVALGHRHLAHVDGGAGDIPAARRAGFERAVRRHRLVGRSVVVPGGSTEEDGRRAARSLLERTRRPTAIAAYNDRSALGVIDAVTRAGLRVPVDVSVTGFDDSPIAALATIDLTSVNQDATRLGAGAVRAALERLDEGRTTPRELTLTPALVARGTSAAAPAAP